MGLYLLICYVAASFLFLQPIVATDDAWPPIFAPFTDNVCDGIDCGNGTCTAYKNFSFACECNPGWRRYHGERFKFLPCVIPNCTLNLQCTEETAPPAPAPRDDNRSFFDPCLWAYCGGGSCVKTSKFGHRCDCRSGFLNLLNVTSFPCLSQCALGADCVNVGAVLSNRSSSSSPSLSDRGSSGNAAYMVPSTHLLCAVVFIISFALVSWI